MVQYSTALSHIVLAGVGLYCLRALNELTLSAVPFWIVVLNSLLGVWRWGNPEYGFKVFKVYRITQEVQDLLVLPLIVTTLWLKFNYPVNLALLHTVASVIPFGANLFYKREHKFTDVILMGNLLSLLVVSYLNNNYYGITTAASYLLSYFFIKQNVICNLPFVIPMLDLFNFSVCFFIFFAVRAILEPLH